MTTSLVGYTGGLSSQHTDGRAVRDGRVDGLVNGKQALDQFEIEPVRLGLAADDTTLAQSVVQRLKFAKVREKRNKRERERERLRQNI